MPRLAAYTGFLDLGYRPTEADVLVEYYVEPAPGLSLADAAQRIAAESSIGTWTDIATLKPSIAKRLAPHVYDINRKTWCVNIAYPAELFEPGNIPQILSSIAGNVFGMRDVANLRLEDFHLPMKLMKSFPGPALGIPGIRKMTGVRKRPLCGTIVKPKLGLSEREHADVAYKAWVNGLDLVKDDENLTSMAFNKFEARVLEVLDAKERAEQETGEKKIAVINVTAEATEMLRRAEFIKEHGGNCAMVDILTAGFSGVQALRKADLGLILHGHRAMHAALTRNRRHGIAMLPLAKFARLAGIDQLHVGAIVGKMEGGAKEVWNIGEEIEASVIAADKPGHRLAENWHGMKPVFAVASGGLHPGAVEPLVKAMGTESIIIQAGGGVHGHPGGTEAGARALRQAVDAAAEGIPLKQAMKKHKELAQAIEKWGAVRLKEE